MKRITFLLLAVLAIENTSAQGITDGLIYSSESLLGTARFNALSGAFGALGGDLSALSINPAGGAVFLNSGAAFSIAGNDTDNRATYFNTRTKSVDTDINLNQAGGVFVFNIGSILQFSLLGHPYAQHWYFIFSRTGSDFICYGILKENGQLD